MRLVSLFGLGCCLCVSGCCLGCVFVLLAGLCFGVVFWCCFSGWVGFGDIFVLGLYFAVCVIIGIAVC